jgi:hypothetical protein
MLFHGIMALGITNPAITGKKMGTAGTAMEDQTAGPGQDAGDKGLSINNVCTLLLVPRPAGFVAAP